MSKYEPVSAEVVAALQTALGAEYVRTDAETLEKYKTDEETDPRYHHLPEVIVWPGSTEEVAAVMKIANQYNVPVTPRSAGTSVSCGAIPVYGGIVLLSGVSWKIILPVFLTGVLLLGGFLFIFISDGGRAFLHNLGMPTYQINRILAWLHPFDYAQTTTFQQAQGQIAVGSGGLTGQGFNVSNLLVPVRESDMIFTVIAEDFGFLGSTLVIMLYLLLIYRMLKITIKSNNQFYTYISTGFIMMLLFHIFENIGAVTGILPLTGIPLPFISQGGSSIISNLIGVGLLLSVSYQNSLTDEKKERIPAVRKKVVLKKLK